jgi:hypothetical protein
MSWAVKLSFLPPTTTNNRLYYHLTLRRNFPPLQYNTEINRARVQYPYMAQSKPTRCSCGEGKKYKKDPSQKERVCASSRDPFGSSAWGYFTEHCT